ncbi:hypothetical protein QJQ45_022098, partial [Haematococcus lacustris]
SAASGKAFSSLQEEVHQLVRACQQLMANAGSWEAAAPPPSSHPSTSAPAVTGAGIQGSNPPHWVWAGLAHLAPEATQVAVEAADVVSALEHFAPSSAAKGPGHLTLTGGTPADPGQAAAGLVRAQALARLALVAAAAVALPKAQEAEKNPTSLLSSGNSMQAQAPLQEQQQEQEEEVVAQEQARRQERGNSQGSYWAWELLYTSCSRQGRARQGCHSKARHLLTLSSSSSGSSSSNSISHGINHSNSHGSSNSCSSHGNSSSSSSHGNSSSSSSSSHGSSSRHRP